MTKPQSPEIARNRLGNQDQDAKELRAKDELPEPEGETGPVPPGNQPGHRAEHEQDKPQGPPPGSSRRAAG